MEDLQSHPVPTALIVVSTDRRRGAEVFSDRLTRGLVGRGWLVNLIALAGTGSPGGTGVETLAPVDLSELGRFDLPLLRALRKRIRIEAPDVVVANGGATLRYVALATIGLKVRFAYLAIGDPSYWIRSRFARLVNRFLLRRADKVLVVSEMTGRQMLQLEPRLAGRVEATFTGVPDELFDIAGGAANSERLNLVYIGSLSREKNPTLALEAAASVPSVNLRFVGDGPLREDLQARSTELGVGDRVEFTGPVADISPHLEWASALILTSLTEGLPGVILEAGAAGVPAISVHVGGVAEAIEDGETGLIVDPSLAELAAAISRLRDEPELRRNMGDAARALVRRRFSLDTVTDEYDRILREVIR